MIKNKVEISKSIYIAQNISDLIRILVHENQLKKICKFATWMYSDISVIQTKSLDVYKDIIKDIEITYDTFIFFNRDSLHARLNSHYKAWSYKKKKKRKKRRSTKRLRHIGNLFRKIL